MDQFFTSFTTQLKAHLLASLEKKKIKVTKADIDDCLNSFEFSNVKGKAGARQCEAMVVDKATGQTRQCTSKSAKNEHEGKWYCGSETSGHYQAALNPPAPEKGRKKAEESEPKKEKAKSAKAEAVSKATEVLKEKVVKSTKDPAKVISEKTILKVGSLTLTCINGYYVEPTHRIALDKNSKMAIGVLKDDNKTLGPLKDVHHRFLQANNIKFEAPKKSKKAVSDDEEETKPAKSSSSKGKKAPPKEESEDESEEEPTPDLSESEDEDDGSADVEEEDGEGDIGDDDEDEEEESEDDD